MLVTLVVPYADTTAADLSFTLDAPEQPALHVLDLDGFGTLGVRLGLRLLGASHQVILRTPDGGRLTETVACLPGREPELPAEVRDDTGDYRFTSTVHRFGPVELTARVTRLRQDLTDDPYALLGAFPGDPAAVTGLRAAARPADGHIGWRTWHAYPQTGELVETETVVMVR